MMLRLAKPKNYIACSPSVTQRSQMKAPEWLPLILEPESKFYTDPVVVIDFQSHYQVKKKKDTIISLKALLTLYTFIFI